MRDRHGIIYLGRQQEYHYLAVSKRPNWYVSVLQLAIYNVTSHLFVRAPPFSSTIVVSFSVARKPSGIELGRL